jgi:hypothetical protein
VKSVKEPKTHILCHEIEPNLSKNRAVHEGDNPSFVDEFMKFTFFLTALLIFVFLVNNYQQFLYNMANNYHLHPNFTKRDDEVIISRRRIGH